MTVKQSAVSFAGSARFHMGLIVSDLDASINFYREVFGQEPTKVREGYAKFEVASPSVNFTLNHGQPGSPGNISHMGIQLRDTGALEEFHRAFQAKGMVKTVEDQTTCCYAVQDKFWLEDPDGNSVEFFVVLEKDAPVATAGACCT